MVSTRGAESTSSLACRSAVTSVAALAVCVWGTSTLTACAAYPEDCSAKLACAPDPEPPPDLCAGEPGTAPALDKCGVFVSEQGDDNSAGTKRAPVRTLQHAIGLAAHGRSRGEAPTRRVYACGGLFAEAISLPQGVDLWGGRLCAGGDWSYGGPLDEQHALTVIAPPVGIPVRVLGGDDGRIARDDTTSVIFGVRAVAADASARDGKSSIAMLLSPGARAFVRASEIFAGDGKDGEPGEDAPSFRASAGVVGNNGVDACTADVALGALPVVTVCDDGIESTGGQGGDGGRETGGDGTSGMPEPVGTPNNRGLAGGGASSMPCKDGERGADGAPAERAAGAVGPGRLGLDGWVGVRGKDGEKGGAGQGGGGGGGGKGRDDMNACPAGRPQSGAAGGSGGSGGCGGKGGKGGGYGGASIAIVALQGSDLTVGDDSTVLGAKGGNGGVGGTGQWGGFGWDGGRGGRGSVTDTSRGCDGGSGGHGGRGGDAGGGLGGHSLGIGSVGASVTILPRATVSPGQPGTGGLGGNATPESHSGQGHDGTKVFWYRFDAPDPEPPQ
ncbi:hypothetical protein SOCE836_033900 [Sorangium cellulosum]|uniref:PGRS family protein n=1 Tax=Sorangium cellulosum TaxID=56 RepID=A0A4P2QN56_SORCE|nr:hypothetical protein SOCE836_033900 [Sorangium cellulosum]WCQ90645.1 hypothetical protein NQZ70_03356 [Sorangium sp. Soce836]